MKPILVALPVLALALMLQTAIVSHITLLSGSADLLLVILAAYALQERVATAWHWAVLAGIMVAFVSALPWYAPLPAYLLVVGAAQVFQRRIWQAPLLAMFAVTFIGTLVLHLVTFLVLQLSGVPLSLGDSFGVVTLPSTLLNLLLSIPVYALMRDLAGWLHPPEAAA